MFDFLVVLFSMFLIVLPSMLGGGESVLIRGLFLMPIFLVIIKNEFWRFLIPGKQSVHFLLRVVLGLQLFSLLRTSLNEEFDFTNVFARLIFWLAMMIYVFSLFSNPKKISGHNWRLVKGIYYSIGLYVLANVILHIAGIEFSREVYADWMLQVPAMLLSLLGISSYRVLFPISSGINSFGIVGGMLLVGSSIFFLSKQVTRLEKMIAFFFALASVYVLLLTDSRGGVLYSFLVVFLLVYLPSKWRSFIRWIPFLVPVGLIIMIVLLRTLPSFVSRSVSRGNDATAASVSSGRSQFWNAAVDKLSEFSFMHLVGYGYAGIKIAGITRKFQSVYQGYTAVEFLPLHNFFLENVFEVGYLGIILTILLQYNLLRKLLIRLRMDTENIALKMIAGIFLYLIVVGLTESNPMFNTPELYLSFLYVSVAALTLGSSKPRVPRPG